MPRYTDVSFMAIRCAGFDVRPQIPPGFLAAKGYVEMLTVSRQRPLYAAGTFDRSAIMAAAVSAARLRQSRYGTTWAARPRPHRALRVTMLITRTSMTSGVTRTLDLPVTEQQLADYEAGGFLQDVFRHLPPWQREFIKTGITDEEWQAQIAEPDEDAEPDDLDEFDEGDPPPD